MLNVVWKLLKKFNINKRELWEYMDVIPVHFSAKDLLAVSKRLESMIAIIQAPPRQLLFSSVRRG